jgi:exopolysaccharide production protein ExoQ
VQSLQLARVEPVLAVSGGLAGEAVGRRIQQRKLQFAVGVFTVLLLANYPLFWLSATYPAYGGAFKTRVPVLLAISSFGIARAARSELNESLRRAWPVLLLLSFALLSVLWTVSTSMTTWSLIEPVTTLLTCVSLSLVFKQQRLIEVVTVGGLILLLFNLYACIRSPETMAVGGPWGGLTGNRNGLGMNTVVVVPFMFFGLGGKFTTKRSWRYPVFGGALILSAYVLYRTGSKTSMTSILVAGWMFGLILVFRSSSRLTSATRSLVRILGVLIASSVTALVTKWLANIGYLQWEATLTRRTPIWKAAIQLGRLFPRTGIGYAGWASEKGYFKQSTWQGQGNGLSHLHNGFIQQFLDLGIVGLALLLLAFGVLGVRWARVTTSRYPFGAGFGLVLWMILVVTNCLESRALWPTFDMLWPMFCLLAVMAPPVLRTRENRSATFLKTGLRRVMTGLAALALLAIPLTARQPYVAPSTLGRAMKTQAANNEITLSASERDVLDWIGWFVEERADLQSSLVPAGVPDVLGLLRWSASGTVPQSKLLNQVTVLRLIDRWEANRSAASRTAG